MRLIPLRQWICDECLELIQKPEDGWLEWLTDDDGKAYGFRVVHQFVASPLRRTTVPPEFGKERGSCYGYDDKSNRSDTHLHHILGHDGMIDMLSYVDIGPIHEPEGKRDIKIKDARSWAETFRRLFVPKYEEARQYFFEAQEDGFYEGANELWPYLQEHLTDVIERYGKP